MYTAAGIVSLVLVGISCYVTWFLFTTGSVVKMFANMIGEVGPVEAHRLDCPTHTRVDIAAMVQMGAIWAGRSCCTAVNVVVAAWLAKMCFTQHPIDEDFGIAVFFVAVLTGLSVTWMLRAVRFASSYIAYSKYVLASRQ